MNEIDLNKRCHNNKEMSKMMFIFNAIEDGWKVKKNKNNYIFSKHKSKDKQILSEDFLNKFITKYFNLN
jgi:hypothetical protein|tara:strand:+ start:662 stop:868 length:207 start_codon:yes stop_codon:yes gene_type:complete